MSKGLEDNATGRQITHQISDVQPWPQFAPPQPATETQEWRKSKITTKFCKERKTRKEKHRTRNNKREAKKEKEAKRKKGNDKEKESKT